MGCGRVGWLVCNGVKGAVVWYWGELTERAISGVGRVVGEEPADEEEACIAGDHAGEGTVVEVRVRLDGFVPAVGGPLGQDIKGEVLLRRHGVVQLLEARHVHCPRIASKVQIVARGRGIGFEEVVRVVDALRCAEHALDVVEGIPDSSAVAADGERRVQRDGIAGPDDTHDGQDEGEIDAHVVDSCHADNGFDKAYGATAVDVAWVVVSTESIRDALCC